MADAAVAEKKDRAASLAETRKAKMDALFYGQKYDILKEIKLEGDDRFETPFGNKGRNGFALKLSTGYTARDGQPDKFVIGETMLRQVSEQYGAVEVPVKERKRRTKEQKAADDAQKAAEKAAKASAAAEV